MKFSSAYATVTASAFLLYVIVVYMVGVEAQYFPPGQLRKLTNRISYQQPLSTFYQPVRQAPSSSFYYPPPPPAFYSPPPASNYYPNDVPTSYIPRNSGSASATFWSGWNSLRSPSLFLYAPSVDALPGSNSIAVVAVDLRGVRATICQAGVSTQNSWVQLVTTPDPVFPIDSPSVTYYNQYLYTVFCGIDHQIYFSVNQVTGSTVSTVAGGYDSIAYATAQVCVGSPSTVYHGSTVWVFVRFITGTDGVEDAGYYTFNGLTDLNAITEFNIPATGTLLFGPVAATYLDSTNMQHLVVAIVMLGGQLRYIDTTSTAPATVAGLAFSTSQLSCIGEPVAISFGTYVNIYCRSSTNGHLTAVTIANGGEYNVETVTDGYVPKEFDGIYALSHLNIFTTAEDGTIYTRILKQASAMTSTNPYYGYYW